MDSKSAISFIKFLTTSKKGILVGKHWGTDRVEEKFLAWAKANKVNITESDLESIRGRK